MDEIVHHFNLAMDPRYHKDAEKRLLEVKICL